MKIKRPSLARFTRLTRRKKILAGVLAVGLIGSTLGGSAYTYLHYSRANSPLPSLKPHADIPLRPMTTYADTLNQELPQDSKTLSLKCPVQQGEWVNKENQNPGIAMTPADWTSIKFAQESGSVLWIDKQTATCGDRIGIHASLYPTNTDGSLDKKPRTFEVLRVGWYNGSGARMVWNSGPVNLKFRNTPNLKNATRTIETRWPKTTSFEVGSDWVPGLYLVASVNKAGAFENIAPFILRATPGASSLMLIHSTLTWAAYNSFGGHSTYSGVINGVSERSQISSLDRPYAGSGMNHISRDAISFVQYLESTGLNIDQITDADISNSPSIVTNYNGIIFSGHPEYMTRTEFDTVAAARNLGINIAFMGANSAYWQSRLEPSRTGPDRHMAIYRDPLLDPQTDWKKVTTSFANPRINTPPSLLTGERTAGVHVTGTLKAVKIPHWLDIPKSAELAGWAANSEIDGVAADPVISPKSHLLFSGKFELVNPTPAYLKVSRSLVAQTIWFTTPSGSATFVAGINYWPCEVSSTCPEATVGESTKTLLQSITSQVLTLWQTKAVGKSLK
jgi:hypothetical protein